MTRVRADPLCAPPESPMLRTAGALPQPVVLVALQVAALNTEIRFGPLLVRVDTYRVPVAVLTAMPSGFPPGTCRVASVPQPAESVALQVAALITETVPELPVPALAT